MQHTLKFRISITTAVELQRLVLLLFIAADSFDASIHVVTNNLLKLQNYYDDDDDDEFDQKQDDDDDEVDLVDC